MSSIMCKHKLIIFWLQFRETYYIIYIEIKNYFIPVCAILGLTSANLFKS